MRHHLLPLLGAFIVNALAAQPSIHYRADLRDLRDDKVRVEMIVPPLGEDELVIAFPRIVPGIYGAMDHGRLASEPRAFDAQGNLMLVHRDGVNGWRIHDAQRLRRLVYRVDDGWENFDIVLAQGNYRSSEGTYSRDVSVINHNALFPYIKGHEDLPCTITMMKPVGQYAATSLARTNETPDSVIFHTNGYRELVDGPILLCAPDTAHIRLPDIDVTVACHSTSGQRIAPEVASHVRPLLLDQQAYLGGSLPVDHYTFLIHHNPSDVPGSSMADGLEHGASTLILLCMPLDAKAIADHVYGVASHEFFHTLLPIGIHSEEIEDHDFQSPHISRHLWLYEGMTEYFAMHMPVKQGRATVEEFLSAMEGKVQQMREFPDSLALTDLSVQAMERQEQYYNFYLKGTLICMLLDLELRERSKGAYGVQQLVMDLHRAYGPGKPFRDAQLFAEIERLSGMNGIRNFLERYLDEPVRIELEAPLARAGIERSGSGWALVQKPTRQQTALRKAWLGR